VSGKKNWNKNKPTPPIFFFFISSQERRSSEDNFHFMNFCLLCLFSSFFSKDGQGKWRAWVCLFVQNRSASSFCFFSVF
jgi:hypothetical protein